MRIEHQFLQNHLPEIRRPLVRYERDRIIQNIAFRSLAELAISLTIGVAVCAFITSGAGISFVICTMLLQNIINFFARLIGTLALQKALVGGPHAKQYLTIARSASMFASGSFAFGTGLNTQTLIHETGHALAAKALYQNANPRIEILPFVGGFTRFSTEKLSFLGRKLGEGKSIALTAAAGPFLSLSVSSGLLASSFCIEKKYPEISLYLRMTSIADFINHTIYALSALKASSTALSHDFVRLRLCGIHPLAAATAIVATPILIACGMQRKE